MLVPNGQSERNLQDLQSADFQRIAKAQRLDLSIYSKGLLSTSVLFNNNPGSFMACSSETWEFMLTNIWQVCYSLV